MMLNNHSGKLSKILILLSISVISLFSCNKKPTSHANDWNKLKSWSFKGKMAINDGQNNGSGRVKWLFTNNTTQAQFKAPLGQGSWTITENQQNARLVSSTNGEIHADTAQKLISQELGWHFPWSNIQYWLRGHQSDTSLQVIKQEKNSFTDDGWKITYTQWTQTPLGLLPKKIKAHKPPYSVKLIIYNWNFE